MQEFKINGSTPEEQAAREAKAAERRSRIVMDMMEDDEALPEQRWPFRSSRAAVRPTPPPPPADLAGVEFGDGRFMVKDTLAAKLKREAVVKARESGQFESKEER